MYRDTEEQKIIAQLQSDLTASQEEARTLRGKMWVHRFHEWAELGVTGFLVVSVVAISLLTITALGVQCQNSDGPAVTTPGPEIHRLSLPARVSGNIQASVPTNEGMFYEFMISQPTTVFFRTSVRADLIFNNPDFLLYTRGQKNPLEARGVLDNGQFSLDLEPGVYRFRIVWGDTPTGTYSVEILPVPEIE